MKKIIIGLVFFVTVQLNAQEINGAKQERIIQADTTKVMFENKMRTCLEYFVDVDFKSLKKDWSSLLYKSYKASVKEKDDVFLITNDVVVTSISDLRLDLLLVIKKSESKSRVCFTGAFGYDIYLDPIAYPNEFAGLKEMVEKFLYDSSSIYYHDVLTDLSEEIAKLNKKNQGLEDDNTKLNAKITKSDILIEELKEIEEGGSVSTKNMKKITKETKRKVDYKADITGNKKEISGNKVMIGIKNDKKDYYTSRQKVLNSNH